MMRSRLSPLPFLALALLAATPSVAQETVQALPGSTDADKLADDMRTLAANPRDVDALVDAARLSLRLDDISGAASLLQRAENIDPRNPRVKAAQASVLVQSERPGQALRYFAQAEAAGLDARNFAADRGLAYDLTGEQARAQRDYARALRDDPDDAETIRRYALSLGISSERQRAMALLDPLVRKSDRAAWRTQAFVLAMTGDVGGASRIAATMIPGGAAGLSAFFGRLPTLSPTDRAFAVHFGEVRPSPERLADARLAPPLSPLPREPGIALAAAQPLPATPPRGRRDRAPLPAALPPVAAARPAPTPTQAAVSPPVRIAPIPTQVAAATTSVVRIAPVSTQVAAATTSPARVAPAPAQVAAAASPPITQVAPPSPVLAAAREPAGTVVATAVPTSLPPPTATTSASPTIAVPAATPPTQIATALPAVTVAVAAPPAEAVPIPAAEPPAAMPAPVQTVALPPSAPAAAPAPAPSRALAIARASEDTILSRIIANLSIPGSELGVEAPERPAAAAAPPPRPEPVAVVVVKAEPDRAAADKLAAEKLAAEKLAADKAAAAKAAADRKAAAAKAVADKKALAEKKAAADKKALADKEAAEKKKAERADPPRIWVQVAGGAYEGDLPKAYATVKAKAPAVFGSRGGWTTPLRATNRVLAGPFKTDAEARAFVNDLKKQGVSAFTFTSDAGQPVKKLGAK